MLRVSLRPPVDYSKCNQTVTLYHDEKGVYRRTVCKSAFLEFRKIHNLERTGSRDASSFLLVIPGSVQLVWPRDKVLLGVGPEISTSEEWRNFIPAKVPGLVVVEYVDLKFWYGKLAHVEAGG